jgi:hypothetical protein
MKRTKRITPVRLPAVGEKVRVRLGPHELEGEVIEDRGDIGAGGRRLLRVAVTIDSETVQEYELPADQVEPVPIKIAR